MENLVYEITKLITEYKEYNCISNPVYEITKRINEIYE